MARSTKEVCPLCGLEFYDLDFHIRVDEECPECANLRNPECTTLDDIHLNPSGLWILHGVGRLLRVLRWC